MDITAINKEIGKLNNSVANHRLSDVFKELHRLTNENQALLILKDKIRKQSEIYNNLPSTGEQLGYLSSHNWTISNAVAATGGNNKKLTKKTYKQTNTNKQNC